MNSKSYKNFLKGAYISLRFIKIEDQDEFFGLLDDLRKVAKKYTKECSYYMLYPHHNLSEARTHGEMIKDICKGTGVSVGFLPLTKERRIDNTFLQFKYQNINITQIIIF